MNFWKRQAKSLQNYLRFFFLGEKLETLQKDFGVAMDVQEMSLFNWHLANLGYANIALLHSFP